MDAPTEMLEFPKLDRIQRRTNRRCADGAIAAELPVRLNRDYGLHRPLQAPAAHQAHSAAQLHFTAVPQSRLTQINFGGDCWPRWRHGSEFQPDVADVRLGRIRLHIEAELPAHIEHGGILPEN